jgi:hypothetical protein
MKKSHKKLNFILPELNFENELKPLQRVSFTTKTLITNLEKHGYKNVINSVFKEVNGKNDSEIINNLEQNILNKINLYKKNPNDELLLLIFHSIQIWGGNTVRQFYFNDGFNKNFSLQSYKNAISFISNDKEELLSKAICEFRNIGQTNIAFASKHFSFWTKDFNSEIDSFQKQLPILDKLIFRLVYGKNNQPDYKHYITFVNDIYLASKKINVSIQNLERQLFNYADTNEGKDWINNRITKELF